MEILEYVHVYIDDLLTITKGTYQNHLYKLRQVLTGQHSAGLRTNANKSSFTQEELEYLGYILPNLTPNGGDHPCCDIALSMMQKQMQQEHCHLCYLDAAVQTDKFVSHFFKRVEEEKNPFRVAMGFVHVRDFEIKLQHIRMCCEQVIWPQDAYICIWLTYSNESWGEHLV